jgi:hypothetical protein
MVLGLPYGLLCGLLLAQVQPTEPAPPPVTVPPSEPAPPPEPLPEPPAFFLGLAIGGGHRLATGGEQLPPAFGMSVATLLGRRYASIALGAGALELGLAAHFDYQRYTRTVTIPITRSGMETSFEDVRTLSYYDFALLQTGSLPLGPVRLVAAAGIGLVIGYFSTLEPALRPGEARMLRPVARGSLGADMTLGPDDGRLGLTVGTTLAFWEPTFNTAQGRTLRVFGDRLSANVSYTYVF